MGSSWARSARRPASSGGRAPGSFALALSRAVGVWDGLTGGPDVVPALGGLGCSCIGPGPVIVRAGAAHGDGCVAGAGFYSVEAAAAIVGLALGLWADTARGMVEDGPGDG